MYRAPAAAELQLGKEEYDRFDFCLRKLLWLRALFRFGRLLADSALADRDNFVQMCLLGQGQGNCPGPPSVEQAAQVNTLQTSACHPPCQSAICTQIQEPKQHVSTYF